MESTGAYLGSGEKALTCASEYCYYQHTNLYLTAFYFVVNTLDHSTCTSINWLYLDTRCVCLHFPQHVQVFHRQGLIHPLVCAHHNDQTKTLSKLRDQINTSDDSDGSKGGSWGAAVPPPPFSTK